MSEEDLIVGVLYRIVYLDHQNYTEMECRGRFLGTQTTLDGVLFRFDDDGVTWNLLAGELIEVNQVVAGS